MTLGGRRRLALRERSQHRQDGGALRVADRDYQAVLRGMGSVRRYGSVRRERAGTRRLNPNSIRPLSRRVSFDDVGHAPMAKYKCPAYHVVIASSSYSEILLR